MIERYSRKKLTDIWSEENKYQIWLDVEIAAAEAMEKLDKRSKEILRLRWLSDEKVTLKELAKKFNVSLERVRQIEEKAILDLREQLLNP